MSDVWESLKWFLKFRGHVVILNCLWAEQFSFQCNILSYYYQPIGDFFGPRKFGFLVRIFLFLIFQWIRIHVRWVLCHHGMARPQVADGGYLRIYWISSCGQPTRDSPPAWRLGVGLTTSRLKKVICYEVFQSAWDLDWLFKKYIILYFHI